MIELTTAAVQVATAQIITNRFGTFTVVPQTIISLPHGVVGMPECNRFCLIDVPNVRPKYDYLRAFKLLQSLDHDEVAFLVLPLDVSNQIISEEDVMCMLRQLSISQDGVVLLLIAMPQQLADGLKVIGVNARAPIVINSNTAVGIQHVIPGTKYSDNMIL
ncbi:MAG: flagellar assembly protein FliW [Proteobacteria bacterium]|nr:flagellar assembly protein FliW [Pseudomonadota bacterium]